MDNTGEGMTDSLKFENLSDRELLVVMATILKRLDRKVACQNGRLRKVEVRQAYLWGGLILVGALIPVVLHFL